MALLAFVVFLSYVPVCLYLGAVRGTFGIAWAFLLPWIAMRPAEGPHDDTWTLVPFATALFGLGLCLAGRLFWQFRQRQLPGAQA